MSGDVRSGVDQVATSDDVVDSDDLVSVSRRKFDRAVDRLRQLLPLDDPSSELWDVYLEIVEAGRR